MVDPILHLIIDHRVAYARVEKYPMLLYLFLFSTVAPSPLHVFVGAESDEPDEGMK
jgi:hypothetical protein